MLKLQFSQMGRSLILMVTSQLLYEVLLASTFSLPTTGVVDLYTVSKEDMISDLKRFSASGEELSPSFFKNFLKMEYQVMADIMAKVVLVEAGTFDRMSKEKIQVMSAITSGVKIIWSSVIFMIFSEMIHERRIGFVV